VKERKAKRAPRKRKPPVRLDGPSKGKHFDSTVIDDPLPENEEVLVESPHAILDSAVSDAARLVVGVANGTMEASREQLASAQDILNRKGITSGGSKTSQIPEAFAREALGNVFRLLGFPPIVWPHLTHTSSKKESDTSIDDFNAALLDN